MIYIQLSMNTKPFNEVEPIIVTDLLGKETQVDIINFLLDNPHTPHRKTDIANEIGSSKTTVGQYLGSGPNPKELVTMGIADLTTREDAMPRYYLADTPVVRFLQQYESYFSLADFFKPTARKLTRFWLRCADPDGTYTQHRITNEIPISTKGFNNNIGKFVTAGIIEKDEYNQRTEYTLSQSSHVHASILKLEDLIIETQQHRLKYFFKEKY